MGRSIVRASDPTKPNPVISAKILSKAIRVKLSFRVTAPRQAVLVRVLLAQFKVFSQSDVMWRVKSLGSLTNYLSYKPPFERLYGMEIDDNRPRLEVSPMVHLIVLETSKYSVR